MLQRQVPGITSGEAPKHSPKRRPRASRPHHGTELGPPNSDAMSMSLEMAMVQQLGLGLSEVRGHGAAKLLRLSSLVSLEGLAPLQKSIAPELRGAPDQEGRTDQLCTGQQVQGMRGRRAAPSAEKTELQASVLSHSKTGTNWVPKRSKYT